MSAQEHLSNLQFSTATSAKYNHGATYAHDGNALDEEGRRRTDNLVGILAWGMDHRDGAIDKVWVHPDHRRAGIATAMLHVAQTAGGTPQHSTIRTEKGEAWARAQGAPPREELGTWKTLHQYYPDPGHDEEYDAARRREIDRTYGS